jgi:adenosylhomocysteine nucleosidase
MLDISRRACVFLCPLKMSRNSCYAVVLISADAEWQSVRSYYQRVEMHCSPYGEWFSSEIVGKRVIFFQGGWGKIAAACSTQHAIDRFAPELVMNLGTCGGFAGAVGVGETIVVEETLVYDILEQMTNKRKAIEPASLSFPAVTGPTPSRS